MKGAPPLRIVLIGFMGAGKSTVGRLLAKRIGWRFADLDEWIEARSGHSVARWFAERGEEAFRVEEAAAGEELMSMSNVVIASGGGWAAQPGRLSGLPEGTLTVWLDVSAEEVLRRVAAEGSPRPLLEGPDREQRVRSLLAQRSDAYALADVRVDTSGHSVDDVTSRIFEILEPESTKTESE